MASIFSSLKQYAGQWRVKSVSNFTAEEQSVVANAEVVPSDYGMSVCFHMIGGGMTFIPLDRDSEGSEGQVVDLATAKLLTLTKQGERDILRVRL